MSKSISRRLKRLEERLSFVTNPPMIQVHFVKMDKTIGSTLLVGNGQQVWIKGEGEEQSANALQPD